MKKMFSEEKKRRILIENGYKTVLDQKRFENGFDPEPFLTKNGLNAIFVWKQFEKRFLTKNG